MTTGIKNYSTTAASNNSAVPNGAPEGWAPSSVNNVVRQIMAEIRGWYEDPTWIDFGYTYTYVGATQFKISGQDQTAKYVVGRRVRAVGTLTGTIYGIITVSAFSTDTTITIVWDSGSLSNETLAISLGEPALGFPLSRRAIFNGETTVASATTTDLASANASVVAISGTTTITSFGSNAVTQNPLYFIRFTGALTLTHNATSLILPAGANITTAAGDTALMKYEGSGNWRCMFYNKATGNPVNTGTSGATVPLLSTANTWTTDQTFSGVATSTHFNTGTLTIADDTATSFTPAALGGMIFVTATGAGTVFMGSALFRAASGGNSSMVAGTKGANFDVTTTDGTLAGTTGTDGNITIRATTSAIYVENRSGASRTLTYTIIG